MLIINNLEVRYKDLPVLWDLSLTAGDSEIVAIVGPNGAGKTTLLRTLSGLVKCSRGSIIYKGLHLEHLPPHQIVEAGIALVPEGRRIFPSMSILENLEIGSFIPRARRIRNRTLKEVYEIFPLLRDRANQPAGTLSGGEQQMLALARALMSVPQLLLIDEMSQGLAPLIVHQLSRVIRQISSDKELGIILVEQNVPLALNIAKRAYILENGRVHSQGPARDLLESPRIKEAYLGKAPTPREE